MIQKERVTARMKRKDISLRNLVKLAATYRPGLSYNTVWEAINKPERSTRLDVIQAIASALGTSVGYLLGQTDQEEPDAPPLGAEALDVARQIDELEPDERAAIIDVVKASLRLRGVKPAARPRFTPAEFRLRFEAADKEGQNRLVLQLLQDAGLPLAELRALIDAQIASASQGEEGSTEHRQNRSTGH